MHYLETILNPLILLIFFILIQIGFFLYYLVKFKLSNYTNSLTINNINVINLILRFEEINKFDFDIKIENFESEIYYDKVSNCLNINSQVAQQPFIENITNCTVYIVGLHSNWFRNSIRIYTLQVILWYLIILSFPFIYIYQADPLIIHFISALLFFLTLISYVDLHIKNKIINFVITILVEYEIIDSYEIRTVKNILTRWKLSSLSFYIAPINDLASFLKFK